MRLHLKQNISILLIAVFALYNANVVIFSHTHYDVNGVKIVHSHPYNDKNHSHTQQEYIVISHLNTANFIKTELQSAITAGHLSLYTITVFSGFPLVKEIHLHTCSLRGPPLS
jgi:hypothetical protein